MLNFKVLYQQAETHKHIVMGGMFFLLCGFILLQTIFSPVLAISLVVFIAAALLTIFRPLWMLAVLAVYFPFESLVLKFVPNDAYVFVRYASEGLIYLIAGVVIVGWLTRTRKMISSPIDLPFFLFCLSLLASVLINFVPPSIALLGVRQIIRFVLVFFLVIQLQPSKAYIKSLTTVLFGVVLFESILGIIQHVLGDRLDLFLLPSDVRNFGEITLTAGVAQFWEPGSRVFSTLGRYDRLGNFLYFFLLIASGFLFVFKEKISKTLVPWIFLLAIPTLAMTYSRASWFAFLLGFLFIGLWIKRDRKVALGLILSALVLISYLVLSGMVVRNITEAPGQTLSERFFETFSVSRWRGEYYGLGRVYWYVQTPLTVVTSAPFFGVGPGQFGGGAVAALGNTHVYERLGLPFGVFGTEGSIDNNWFSLWGETGTIGVGCYVWMMIGLFLFAMQTYRSQKDPFVRALALGYAACILAISFNAFTSPIFEIRTLAFYLWLYGGFVVVLGKVESSV